MSIRNLKINNIFLFKNKKPKLKIDNREFIDGVLISDTMEIQMKANQFIRATKYKIRKLFKK
ncbi:MAG: hypothetical protein IJ565_04750 [Bacilli bacterium]|nr:hypothetical protein [Bacilli bacterium]